MADAQPESNEVVIPMKAAMAGLPAVCAITGGSADGAMPVRVGRSITRWNAPVVRVPLSEPVFNRWSKRKNLHIKARAFASVLTAVAIVITFRNSAIGIGVLAVAILIHLVDLWAERQVGQLEPELKRQGSDLTISGVHAKFAKAVGELA